MFISKYCKSFKIADDPFDKPPCRGCSSYLTEPYIKCAECGPSHFLLCLQVNMSHTCHTHAWVFSESLFVSKPHNLTDGNFCFQCFTKGFEYKKHKSDHRYEIMVSDSKFAVSSNCVFDFKFLHENRPLTSPYWSLDGRHRRKWLCWRPSWTAALETGEWPQIWISQSLLSAVEIVMTADFYLFCKFVICWWKKV